MKVADTIKEQREAADTEGKIPRRLDGLETALMQGKVVDQDFKPVHGDKNLATQPAPHILDSDEQRSHKGELKAGDIGWVELDALGKPVGAATKFPKKNVPMAPVSTIVEATPTVLATPAGAFLTEGGMNPSPASYKYNSSAYGRDYAPFAERSMKRWGLTPDGSAATKEVPPARTPNARPAA
jgi:hypothetical protein